MLLLKFLKWALGIFLCLSVLALGVLFIISLIGPRASINQTTKTCVVTGVSSGIGAEIAREMVKKGWTVIGVARREEKLKHLAHELGDRFIFYVCDVGSLEQVHFVCQEIKKQQLKPTLFFLNAGMGDSEPAFKPFFEEHKQIFATNYFGVIAWVDEWINEVKAYGGGTFVATSSVASLFSGPWATGYGASKAALNACFRSLQLKYARDDIGFVVVLPGPVQTDLLKIDKPLPFTHQPSDEARYIIKQVFNGKSHIEPSWIYAWVFRLLSVIPDTVVMYFSGDLKYV